MSNASTATRDAKHSLQLFLVLDGLVRLFVWSSSIAFTVAIFTYLDAWPGRTIVGADLPAAWVWTRKLTDMVLLFNVLYVVHLIVLRLLIPTPKEGRYEIGQGQSVSRQVLWSALIATLTKARYEPPFPGFLVFHLANLPPLRWLMGPIFGPRSQSCYAADPCILDPYNVTIGRNVIVGFGTTIAGHWQEPDAVLFKKTVIEDDVLIGGHSAIAGARIQRGAVIGAGSIVLPGSVIGPGEYWSGNPARRRPAPWGRAEPRGVQASADDAPASA